MRGDLVSLFRFLSNYKNALKLHEIWISNFENLNLSFHKFQFDKLLKLWIQTFENFNSNFWKFEFRLLKSWIQTFKFKILIWKFWIFEYVVMGRVSQYLYEESVIILVPPKESDKSVRAVSAKNLLPVSVVANANTFIHSVSRDYRALFGHAPSILLARYWQLAFNRNYSRPRTTPRIIHVNDDVMSGGCWGDCSRVPSFQDSLTAHDENSCCRKRTFPLEPHFNCTALSSFSETACTCVDNNVYVHVYIVQIL